MTGPTAQHGRRQQNGAANPNPRPNAEDGRRQQSGKYGANHEGRDAPPNIIHWNVSHYLESNFSPSTPTTGAADAEALAASF